MMCTQLKILIKICFMHILARVAHLDGGLDRPHRTTTTAAEKIGKERYEVQSSIIACSLFGSSKSESKMEVREEDTRKKNNWAPWMGGGVLIQ